METNGKQKEITISISMKSPIFITGIERSGSTIIAKIFEKCDAYAGDVSEKMENLRIKQLLNNYYRIIGADKNGQFPLPIMPISCDDWKSRVLEKIDTDRPWFFKTHRIFQTWWLWNSAFPNAKWVIVRRRSTDIVNSCIKTGYMTAFKNPVFRKVVGVTNEADGWAWWISEQHKIMEEMLPHLGNNVRFIWPEKMANGDFSQIKSVVEWCGLTWDDSIMEYVSPLLWKGRKIGGK